MGGLKTETGLQEESFEKIEAINIDKIGTASWLLRPIQKELVTELARSIQNTGLLQPIVVRKGMRGYEVVFGNHRLEACKRLGFRQINAIIRTCDDDEAFLARVSENLLRNAYIDPIEEAHGYKVLVDKGWTINAIGQRVGKCDSYISERLGIFHRLSQDIHNEVSRGLLTPSHAELLSRIRNPKLQKELAELVKKKRLSVRSLESMLKHAPLPTKVTTESISNEYFVRVPSEFAAFMGLNTGQQLFMYARGQKLILEKTQSLNTPKKMVSRTRKRV